MKLFLKRIIVGFVLLSLLCFNLFVNVSASNINSDGKNIVGKINIVSDTEIEYIYEENGNRYMVKEHYEKSNNSYKVFTKIFLLDTDNSVLVEEFITAIEQNNNCDISVKKYDAFGTLMDKDIISKTASYTRSYTGTVRYDYVSNKYFTDWFHQDTLYSDTRISKYTILAIATIISISSGIKAIQAAFSVAATIIAEEWDVVYLTTDISTMNVGN